MKQEMDVGYRLFKPWIGIQDSRCIQYNIILYLKACINLYVRKIILNEVWFNEINNIIIITNY